ncbi:HAD-superfamily subfamily IB hydrolase [Nitzschia inconspicua]|uniref:HAD-superfamily subfamily IB hydrolase n=1 Tax=Nitzschia inconspicua TaxID=303405 RepID=A0A9K3L486_9STRA|nr:HAD-superfamily subfamily IB hydrolase [Nitzschia inconspicua]
MAPKKQQYLRPGAFFDFDKTILATDSQGKEAEDLWKKSWEQGNYWLFLKMAWFAFFWCTLYEWGLIGGETINRVYIFLVYREIRLRDLEENGRLLYSNVLRPLLYDEMLLTMKDHHEKGHAVIVVSATPVHLLQPFVDEFREIVDAMSATRIEVGVSGLPRKGVICIGNQKAVAQRRFAEELGLNLATSFAYTDHHHDIEFLESVKHKIVVNPTPQLENIAKKREWKILRFQAQQVRNT